MTEENNTISKLENLLREIEKQDYIKIKYEDLTEMLKETINLMQKQQEGIEKKDKIIDNLIATLASTHAQYLNNNIVKEKKYKEQLEALNSGWKIVLEEKDKIIDRIYDFIWENDCCRYFYKQNTACNKILNFDSCLGNCKRHCINKYFEKKVEENE